MGGDAMTINLEEIYDQYRKADFTDRLNIYLQFPELRNDFLEIEQKDRHHAMRFSVNLRFVSAVPIKANRAKRRNPLRLKATMMDPQKFDQAARS